MSKTYLVGFFLLLTTSIFAQDISISGKIMGTNSNPIPFVSVLVFENETSEPLMGASSLEDGTFKISGLEKMEYRITFSYIGYEDLQKIVIPTAAYNMGSITLKESRESLDETLISIKKPTVTAEMGKLVFNVENTSLSTGNSLDLLKKTPGVLVINNKLQVKFSTPVVYINGKRVYLSSSEIASLLQNMDASIIKSVEVITNPSAKYDAESGAVINIITSRAISVGYKGSLSAGYEQGIYPKYNFASSHFYKNDWVNFYGSYSFSPRKEFKEDDNYIRFFEPNGNVNSIWESKFHRTTKSYGQNGNLIADFTLDEKNSLSISSNVSFSPNKKYNNNVAAEIFNAQKQLDSTFRTESSLENDSHNLSFNADYNLLIGDKGAKLKAGSNYIAYKNNQFQTVSTSYFLPNMDFIRNNSFYTISNQKSNIFTAQLDLTTPFISGNLETGLKYSNIDTKSGLDFFTTSNNTNEFNAGLSDFFVYKESIYAGYFNFSKEWEKWNLNAGVRGEYTDVNGDSRALGMVNTQTYLELFPTASIQYKINDYNNFSVNYARSIQRPRYESLNPFKYFINENNFNGGNPNLVPAIDDKITLSYSHKNKWFFDLYYQKAKKTLSILTFQDNENRTLRNLDANLIGDFQYSLDIKYISSLFSWWYLSATTSSFYLENEFYSIESTPETYSNNTFGFYGQIYNSIDLSKDGTFTSDIIAFYFSDYIYGSYNFDHRFNFSFSLRKTFWNDRASISAGVDDIFNTNNVLISSKYYNQDNSYFPHEESRIFKIKLKYNFGNAWLSDNNRRMTTEESERLD